MKKKIILCSSITFYKDAVEIKKQLTKLGFEIVIPELAEKMEQEGNFDVEFHRKSYYGNDPVGSKGKAIKTHFNKISGNDALLVINNEKHGLKGYIGPNVFMEMGVAYHENIPIFVLNPIEYDSPFIEEINAMSPVWLNRKIEMLKKHV